MSYSLLAYRVGVIKAIIIVGAMTLYSKAFGAVLYPFLMIVEMIGGGILKDQYNILHKEIDELREDWTDEGTQAGIWIPMWFMLVGILIKRELLLIELIFLIIFLFVGHVTWVVGNPINLLRNTATWGTKFTFVGGVYIGAFGPIWFLGSIILVITILNKFGAAI